MPFFNKTHERILRKFLFHRVDFVLIGGHAAVFYGVRRTTSDIDILVQPTLENGHRIIRAFQDLKLEIDSIQASDFTMEQLFTFGVEPNAVDILNFSKGVSVETIFKNALSKKIDDFAVKIIDIRDLVKNKESLNRTGEKKIDRST